MRQPHRRDCLKADLLGGTHAAMTGEDLAVVANQDRVREAKPPDALGDLGDLLFWSAAARCQRRVSVPQPGPFRFLGWTLCALSHLEIAGATQTHARRIIQ